MDVGRDTGGNGGGWHRHVIAVGLVLRRGRRRRAGSRIAARTSVDRPWTIAFVPGPRGQRKVLIDLSGSAKTCTPRSQSHDLDRPDQLSRAIAFARSERPHGRRVRWQTPAACIGSVPLWHTLS
jgi:hypothetical protein